jgi:hypothetical protein
MSHINFFIPGGAPSVPTNFTTDDSTVAVPVANNINIFSNDTIDNNINGIQTTASGDSVFIELTNRVSFAQETSDGIGQDLLTTIMTCPPDSAVTFKVLVTAVDIDNQEVLGGEQIGVAKTFGGLTTIIGLNDTFDEYEAGLSTSDWNVVTIGLDTLLFNFVGVAGKTIYWKIVFEYDQSILIP